MKLIRFGEPGAEAPGCIDRSGAARDLSGIAGDWAGSELSDAALARIASLDLEAQPELAAGTRLGPPVAGVGKMICIGLNYADHAAESQAEPPSEPVVFFKATTAITGPMDPVVLPVGSQKSDWEVELGVVIGRRASYVAEEDALDHVAGYLVVNDLSERAYQLERGGQWVKGKSCDTFAPLGPWLVTRDEVPDPQALSLFLRVNGHTFQRGTTANMIFSVAHIVSYLSQFMTLVPGDIISTGTPAGVGLGQKPPVYLKPGDVMELGIEGLGDQRQDVVAHPDDRR